MTQLCVGQRWISKGSCVIVVEIKSVCVEYCKVIVCQVIVAGGKCYAKHNNNESFFIERFIKPEQNQDLCFEYLPGQEAGI
jgi:hypothetical protein